MKKLTTTISKQSKVYLFLNVIVKYWEHVNKKRYEIVLSLRIHNRHFKVNTYISYSLTGSLRLVCWLVVVGLSLSFFFFFYDLERCRKRPLKVRE